MKKKTAGPVSNEKFGDFIKGKNVLVTGGSGSIGKVIVESLLQYNPKKIAILSRDAGKQIVFQNAINAPSHVRFLIGDIRDMNRIEMACEDTDVIFHAAAFKHVPQGEYNPFEVIQTNVMGTQNLINAALRSPRVSHFVMISTDKAVAPVSTMGASKLLAERLVSAAHYIKGKKKKVFTTVRFGNVLGSSGSVLELFKEQAKRGEIVITHPEMARFFMTISDAVNLVFNATMMAHGGEIFVLKMPAVDIKDLAAVCAKRLGPAVKVRTGSIRPGERIHEALLTSAEARSTLETDKLFVIVPQVETANVFATDYTYPTSRPLTTEEYKTESARRLSHAEIGKLLDRAQFI